jgi:hypothetical protein
MPSRDFGRKDDRAAGSRVDGSGCPGSYAGVDVGVDHEGRAVLGFEQTSAVVDRVAPGVERQRDARAVRKDSARVDEGQIVGRLDAFVANLTGGEGVDRAFVGERRGRFSVAGDVAAGAFDSDGAGPGDGVGAADREIAIAPDIDRPAGIGHRSRAAVCAEVDRTGRRPLRTRRRRAR